MFGLFRVLGSLKVAVSLLVAIAAVLGFGTIYEARFGTASVQQFIYQSWWFQSLLGFLAVNLAVAAWQRFPWQRKHIPFVSAHIGIIGILIGGILGGRFGVEGQMIIPEGQARSSLEGSQKVLSVYEPNPGVEHVFLTHFEAAAWKHEPDLHLKVPLEEGALELVVDRYYPNARIEEGLSDHPRGVVFLRFSGMEEAIQIPVPDSLDEPMPVGKTPYRITFKQFFPDLLVTKEGVTNRSDHPDNPAVAFTLRGSEGSDAYLLFARHPHWQRLEGVHYKIPVELRYAYPTYFNPDDEVRMEVLHLVGKDEKRTSEVWLPIGEEVSLSLGKSSVHVQYRQEQHPLPFSVKLLDFRKTDYPGTQMPAAFESDVELRDAQRGVTLRRTIRMNNPLKYRGFSLFQASYIINPVEMTVLSVRKDPGTPLVYAGFLMVVFGVVGMFIFRRDKNEA